MHKLQKRFAILFVLALPPAAVALAADGLDAAAMSALGISSAEATAQAPPRMVVPHTGSWTWTNGPFQYDGSGNIIGIGNQTFRYDEPGRLAYASISRQDQPGFQVQTYGYDIFGNMLQRSINGLQTAYPTNSATNRLNTANVLFDEAGNLTRWQAQAGQVYEAKFDALNMAQELWAGASRHIYLYTADDERIWTWDTTSSPNVSHWKLRGLDRMVLRDFENRGSDWTLSRDYIHRGGALLAAVTPAGTLYFSLDHLGTPRVITDDNAVRVGFHHYFPFGEEWTLSGNAQEQEPMKFTGHERDADPAGSLRGLDYMHARYYSADNGRFLSVDPVLNIKGGITDPQQWNRYSYVRNSPLMLIDPTGRQVDLPIKCDNNVPCKELRDLRNGVPPELRIFVRSMRLADGRVVVNKFLLNAVRDKEAAKDASFQSLVALANDSRSVSVTTTSDQYLSIDRGSLGVSRFSQPADPHNRVIGFMLPETWSKLALTFVSVDPTLSPRQAARTLAHELYGHTMFYFMGSRFTHSEVPMSVFDRLEDEAEKNFHRLPGDP